LLNRCNGLRRRVCRPDIGLPLEFLLRHALFGAPLRPVRALLTPARFPVGPVAPAILTPVILTALAWTAFIRSAIILAITAFILAAIARAIILAALILAPIVLPAFVRARRVLTIFLAAIIGAIVAALVEATIVAVALFVLEVGHRLIAARTLLFEARPALAEHPEIMIGELQIIFGHHAVALHLGIPREALILFVQLAGVAARAAIQTTAAVRGAVGAIGRTRPAAAATAAVLTIVDQLFAAFVTGELSPLQIRASPGYTMRVPRCMNPGPAGVHDHRMSVPPKGSASLWVREDGARPACCNAPFVAVDVVRRFAKSK
jgi:hypothetical protein